MSSLLRASIIFSVIMLVPLFSKQFQWKYWWRYIIMFFGLWWGEWYFSSQVQADEYICSSRAQIEINLFWQNYYPDRALSQKTRQIYQANADWHSAKAYEEFNQAKEKCWWLPNLKDREKSKRAWTAFIAIISPVTPLYKAIGILLAVFADYGVHCIDEWYDIKELLDSALANAEMAKFYQDLLSKD